MMSPRAYRALVRWLPSVSLVLAAVSLVAFGSAAWQHASNLYAYAFGVVGYGLFASCASYVAGWQRGREDEADRERKESA